MKQTVYGMLYETVGMMFSLAAASGYVPVDARWSSFTLNETRGQEVTETGPFWWQVVPAYLAQLGDPELSDIIECAELWFGDAPPQLPASQLLNKCIHLAQSEPIYAEWRAFIAGRPEGAPLKWARVGENERHGYVYRFWF